MYKTVFLISLALIEIEKVSLCHSISLPTRNHKNTKFLASLSFLAQIFQSNSLIRYLLSAQEEPFCSVQGGGRSLHLCISSRLKNMQRVFPEMENNLLLFHGFFMLHLYTKPQEELGILCVFTWRVTVAKTSCSVKVLQPPLEGSW